MNRTLRILNVEDSEQDSTLVLRHLEKAGHEITWERVETADAFRFSLEGNQWDLILCDYSMPGFSAVAALAVLREFDLDIPFIIISATVGEEIAFEALLSGANDYIPKGNLARLIPALERELVQAENRRAKQQAEADRRQSDDRYRALFDCAPDGIIISGPDGYYLDANPSMCKMLGYTHQELVGMHASDIVIRSEALKLESEFALVQATPEYNREWHFRNKDGSVFPGEVIATIMPDGNLLAMIRDVSERNRAEEKLREKESLLSTTQSIAHLGSWVLDLSDPNTRKEIWSDEHYRIYGFEPGEVEVTDEVFYNSVHPDDRELVARTIREAIEGKAQLDLEHRIILRDGRERIVHAISELITDEKTGAPIKLLGSVQDITERRNTEEALRGSEERYRSVVQTAPDVIVTIDDSSTIRFVNPAAERIFGYSVDELTGASLSVLMPENLRDRHAAGMKRYQDTGVKQVSWAGVEVTGLHKSGREIPITISFSEFVQNGRRLFTGIIRDITERKQTMAALSESEDRYRDLVEHSHDLICTHDLDGQVLSVNQTAARILGYAPEMVLGRNIRDALSSQFHEGFDAYLEEIQNNGFARGLMSLKTRSGAKRIWEYSNTLRVEGVAAPVVRGVARDVTEQRIAEAALRRSEEQYRELVENAIDIIYTLDREGNYTSVNQAAEHITGYRREQTLTRNITQTVAPEYQERAAYFHAEQLAGRDVAAFELEVIAKDGHRVALEINTRSITENGATLGVQGVARDITKRKAAEAARLASERKYQDLFTLAPVGIYQSQPDGTLITVNDSLANMLEYDSADELLGKTLADIYFNPGERSKLLDEYEKMGSATDIDVLWKRKDGAPIWVQLTCHVIKGAHDSPEYFEGFVRDITKQKSDEDDLRESDEKFHQLADNISDVFWIRSPDMSKIYYISPAYEWIWGRKLESNYAHPQDWQDFIFAPDRQSVKEAYQRLISESSTIEIDYRIVRPNGEQRWVKTRGFQVKDPTGEVIRLAGIVTDITEKKHADALLIESQQSLALATESARIGIWDWDLVGDTMRWDARMYDLYGNHDEDFSGPSQTWNFNLHPDDRDRVYAEYDTSIDSAEEYHSEFRVVWPNGEVRHLESSAKVLRDENGTAAHFIGVIWDITERKLAEETLREADQRAIREYGLLLTRVSKLALALGEARDLNRIFEELREFASVSTGMDGFFISLFDPERKTRTAAYLWSDGAKVDAPALPRMEVGNSPHSRSVLSGEIIITDDFQNAMDGQQVVHLSGAMPQSSLVVPMSVMGKIVGGVEVQSNKPAAFKDNHATAMQMAANLAANAIENVRLLEIERMQGEQLRQSQKMEAVGVLAGGIAHDFNNLLTAINGYSDLTLRKMSVEEPLRRNIEEIKKSGSRAAELTSQLLAFSRKQVLKPVVHNLNPVIENIENMLRRLIREDIELKTVLDADLGNIRADPGQIEQVIVNLAVNARDAMPHGGTLTIETKNVYLHEDYVSQNFAIATGPFVRLTVTDTGEGMDAEIQRHIFEPFFTTKEVGKGTGLGLSMVYGIVKQSGGDVVLSSEPGYGTTFKIYLPRIDEQVEKPKWIGDSEGTYLGTETILLVEDEQVVRQLVREILTGSGYTVLEAENGKAALDICSSHKGQIDMLLTDVIMPKMSGGELREIVVGILPDIKVLLMSGYTDDSLASRGVSEADIPFIEKPFTPDELCRKVRDMLE